MNVFCRLIQAPVTCSRRGQAMRVRIEDDGKKQKRCGTWRLVSLTYGEGEVQTKMSHLVLVRWHTRRKTISPLRERGKEAIQETVNASCEVGNPVVAWCFVCDFGHAIVTPSSSCSSSLGKQGHAFNILDDLHSELNLANVSHFPIKLGHSPNQITGMSAAASYLPI